MKIEVVSASGVGKTLLSAFDAALKAAGVYNYNLLVLSSVIPLGASVVKKTFYHSDPQAIGHRLYVVKADIRSDHSGNVIASALGWYFLKNGAGVFVEHEAEGLTKKGVKSEITFKVINSLQDLVENRGETFNKNKVGMSVAITKVDQNPTCALTLAVYKSEPW